MTLNKLLNNLLTEGPYQDEAADILEHLNAGYGAVWVKTNDGPDKQRYPAVLVVNDVEIPLNEERSEALQMQLWTALIDAHKEANHVEG